MKKIILIFSLIMLFSCAAGEKYVTLENEEFAAGHIPGALDIDVKSADFDIECDRLDTARDVVVYCRSGVRSRTAAERLTRKGFTVYNLKNGISGWDGKIVK